MISPVPIIAVILMLVTPKARVNGPAFLVGWLLGLAVIGTIVLVFAGSANANDGGQPATWVDVLKLVLGLLLVLVAAKQWRGRPHGDEEPPAPKWMGAIDAFTPPKALGAGAVLAGANPKNLLLSVGAAATIAQTGISGGEQAVAYAVFALIGTIGGCDSDRHLLRARRQGRRDSRAPQGLDGSQQRRDHGRAVRRHRREADRRCDHRVQQLSGSQADAVGLRQLYDVLVEVTWNPDPV